MTKLFDILRNHEETVRLDRKTNPIIVEKQAQWAGIKPGMRVADLGFGSGKTTFYLNKLVEPNGETVGVEIVEDRVKFAIEHYSNRGIKYLYGDIREPLDALGLFDFVWIRFVLEYHRSKSFEIIKNVSKILKPGGILCLIDLDYNCLNHFPMPARLERAVLGIMKTLELKADFDPYVGKKLYSYLYDLNFGEIKVDLAPHQIIFGELKEVDDFNWMKKVELAGKNSGYQFSEYAGGFEEFFKEFQNFFINPRRFTYNLVISCRGRKPKY